MGFEKVSVENCIFAKKTLKTILILGANSDVAKQVMKLYIDEGYFVMAASRNLSDLEKFQQENEFRLSSIALLYFDAEDHFSHQLFYQSLPYKPHIVIYAAGNLSQNTEALAHFDLSLKMMQVNYIGAVSILNIIAMDATNHHLEKIIGLSSLSGVRGRKSNFVYGSTKAAFTQYLAGLRQELKDRKIEVNVLVLGYINSKINVGLSLNKNLMMEPEYVAKYILKNHSGFIIVPNWKWKIIYTILKILPERWVAILP